MKLYLKHITLITLFLLGSILLNAQNISINTNGATPDASAMLDISDTASGILIPRMTAAQRLLIPSPSNGLLVFQTDFPEGFYVYYSIHSAWARIMVDSVLSLETVLELGNDANADTIINLNALAIGGTNPTSPLHISVDGAPQVLAEPASTSSNDASIVIRGHRNSHTSVRQSSLHFQNFDSQLSVSNSLGTISGVVTDDVTNIGDMVFYNYPDGLTITEAMRIKSDGNVGIGTDIPGDKLEVFNAGNARIRTNTSTNGYSGLVANNSLGEYFVGVQGSADPVPGEFHIFQNAGSGNSGQRLVIDHDGNVGIGKDSPASTLDVNGTITTSGELNTTATGGFNMVPIAMVGVNSGGAVVSGSGNFTVNKTGTGVYLVTVTGHTANINQDIVSATLVFGSGGEISVGNSGSDFIVNTRNSTGTLTDQNFNLIIYSP